MTVAELRALLEIVPDSAKVFIAQCGPCPNVEASAAYLLLSRADHSPFDTDRIVVIGTR